MAQVAYFKYTKKKYGEGRRIFKMTPLHHHFQKAGECRHTGVDTKTVQCSARIEDRGALLVDRYYSGGYYDRHIEDEIINIYKRGKNCCIRGRESGAGAAVLAKAKGFDVFVSDFSSIKPKYKEMLDTHGIRWEEGQHTEADILNADEIIKSPGNTRQGSDHPKS